MANDEASGLARLIFDPHDQKWKDEFNNRIIPVLAMGMLEAMDAQMLLMEMDMERTAQMPSS